MGKSGEPLIDPVLEYSHTAVGIAIVGGVDYQGSAIAGLAGRYVFADFTRNWTTLTPVGRGTLLAATPAAGSAPWTWTKLSIQDAPLLGFVTGIGQDAAGEIYILTRNQLGPTDQTGRILEVIPPG